ncbi:hypothetical protein HHL19_09890 [Streptomyces sp. R302]|uniref:hypothetical protein n=1 Tax=unclassified Streptomyces TaxID=2593676 RepID=UPI00145F1CF0|nr:MULTISPECIES: hypothetical protein [unclassified Streptomyces]NML49979.1 hypothetical protein [Streptomyces sp. R301]NML78970.1 hypothetical protein [Streptomyces sp. R302]
MTEPVPHESHGTDEPSQPSEPPRVPHPRPPEPPRQAANRLAFGDLERYPVVAQALDNQWLPEELAAGRQSPGAPLRTPGAAAAAAAELRRALVNSGTLVVNRAFFVNNEALYENYVSSAEPAARGAFVELLNEHAIVPYLYTERDGTEEFRFHHHEPAAHAWRRLVREESTPAFVRLDWDDEGNLDHAHHMGQRFTQRLAGLKFLKAKQLAQDLGIPLELATAMKQGILQDITRWAGAQDGEGTITRNTVYQEFLSRPGTEPYQNLLRDGDDIVPAKQLIDLLYNLGVPDASGLVALTPPGSPARRAIQEDVSLRARTQDPEAVGLLIRNLVADSLHRSVDGPNSYAGLSLPDVVALRRTPEWEMYVDSLEGFLHDSFRDGRLPGHEEFVERTETIARDHARMLRTARLATRSTQGFAREITTALVLESAGIAVQIVSGEPPTLTSGALQALTAVGGALSVRLEFWDEAARSRRSGLGHSLTLPTLRLGNLRKDWAVIQAASGMEFVRDDRERPRGGQADQQAPNDE